ncbi:LysR family transcriptional regulator [Pseudonocardia sp. ICBG601]|uniref:LysR family transcriptional regulator n=1 Tax=Pseudonocardia sp. ICBG601 TaxID=2846759 RepID=UPI001CF6EE6A|nr:LysR family transcriptional regulator [Pseudonocardia sp. ICBG601]
MAFTLEQLRGFVTVADELHFGRAAARLSMTQPPLSRQIQKLERAVGAQLLDRDNRSVALTPAGAAFLTEARRLLALAEAAPGLARRVSSGSAGLLRISFTAASAFGGLGALLNALSGHLPDVELVLSERVTRDQVAALHNEEIDLGMGRPPVDADVFDSRLLSREAVLVALPAGHPLLSAGRPLTGADLAGEPVIMHSPLEARYFYDLVVRLVHLDHQNVVHTVSQILTMLWLVEAGRGLAFVPASARRLGIDGVGFAELAVPADVPADPVELHLIWRRDSRNPALWSALRALGDVPEASRDA